MTSVSCNRSLPPSLSWERGHLGRHFSGRDARAPRGGVNGYCIVNVNRNLTHVADVYNVSLLQEHYIGVADKVSR